MKQSWLVSTRYFIWEVLKIAVTSFVIVWVVRTYLFQSFYVKGTSMEPNIHERDCFIVNEVGYRLSDPKRGDIVVIRDPRNTSQFFIKRIIGLPGEKVEIKNGEVIIYEKNSEEGMVLSEEYLPEGRYTSGDEIVEIHEGEYFVMGDNRGASLDSRVLGVFDESAIVGKAWIRIWPLSKLDIMNHPNYAI